MVTAVHAIFHTATIDRAPSLLIFYKIAVKLSVFVSNKL